MIMSDKKIFLDSHLLPLKHSGPVHNGKVRSVYWLKNNDSQRLIEKRNYNVPIYTQLGVMITSDKISAFDVIWGGIYGKGY